MTRRLRIPPVLVRRGGRIPCPFALLIGVLCLSACGTLPFRWYHTRSWSLTDREGPRLRVTGVYADVTGPRMTVEEELSGLAPLIFGEMGFVPVLEGEAALYEADIRIREREYTAGWKTVRSLAAEVLIRRAGDRRPLAVGRVTVSGEESFSSSRTSGRMLELAIRKAAGALGKGEGE